MNITFTTPCQIFFLSSTLCYLWYFPLNIIKSLFLLGDNANKYSVALLFQRQISNIYMLCTEVPLGVRVCHHTENICYKELTLTCLQTQGLSAVRGTRAWRIWSKQEPGIHRFQWYGQKMFQSSQKLLSHGWVDFWKISLFYCWRGEVKQPRNIPGNKVWGS